MIKILVKKIESSNKKYNIGDRVFIISNGVKVDELTVIAVSGNFYTLRYVELGGRNKACFSPLVCDEGGSGEQAPTNEW